MKLYFLCSDTESNNDIQGSIWSNIHSTSGVNIQNNIHNLVPILQFKKREKHPRRSVDVSKVAGFKPVTLLK